MKKLIIVLSLAIAVLMLHPVTASAANLSDGAKIFNANCSACHVGGNNIIINSKTLKKGALEKYGMYSLDAIKTQVTNGKNSMPAFKSRLTSPQIESVAAYVLSQADKGW